MTIAIYISKIAAQTYADKIHAWLIKNRLGYNADRWCDVEASKDDTGLKYYIKIPPDYEVLNTKIPLAKDKLTLPTVQIIDKLPDDWRTNKVIE